MFSELGRGSPFSGVELILSCGDLPPEHLRLLAEAFGVPLYYVRGNHDRRLGLTVAGDGSSVHAQLVQFRGVSVLGLEGSAWYNGGPYQYTESQMRGFIRRVRPALRRNGRLDVVVAHAAPRDLGDAPDPCHRGFRAFRKLIERYRPRYFLHGHVHRRFDDPSERVLRYGDTQVVNCSGFHLLELEEDAADG